MRAVVLVGGFGTRLRPLTNSVPKPMLPVGHVAIIERLIANLARGGVDDVTLALGFKPEPFVAAFPDGTCSGVALHYAVEPEPLDTGGAIGFAARFADIDSTFVVANGDILTDLDVTALVDFHQRNGAEATLHLTPVDDPSAFGVVDRDEVGRVRQFVEKPAPGTAPSNLINAGTYVFEPSMIGRIAPDRKVSVEREIFPGVVADGGLWALPTDDYWVDTGLPEIYLQANLDTLGTRRAEIHRARPIAPGAALGADVAVHDSVIAAGASIGDGASVTNSVVLDGGRIGTGATVSRSIVMGRVGDGAIVADCVIGADAVVPDGDSRSGERIG